MRAGIPFIVGLCLCAVPVAGCASAPSHVELQSTFDAGLKEYDAGNYKAAFDKWRTIDAHNPAAARNVALMLRRGQGVPKDPKAALEEMELAARTGLPTAQADLGDMLLKGEAGPPDPKAAFPWLARAAEAGHPVAAFQLAQLFETGTKDIPKDIETARRLYQVAVDGGHAEAAQRLAALPPVSTGVPPPPAQGINRP